MSDLISRENLYEKIKNVYIASLQLLDNSSSAYASCLDVIKNAPTIDAVEQSSNCHTHWDVSFQYCPNCGAKMDEVTEDV